MQELNLPMQWYTRRGGVIRGPFSEDEITRHFLLGRLCLNDELSQDGVAWASANDCTELLPSAFKKLSSWDDYQQLLIIRMKVDERKGDRRRQQCSNRPSRYPDRRTSKDRRGNDNDRLASQDRLGNANSSASRSTEQKYVRPWLLTVVLVTMVLAWLVPSRL